MSRAKPIMIQGTMSGAGKSLLCTALCRIFAQDGYRVAPFKSQNMALNSCVTDGGEIGRAQAVQAAAAGVRPDVRMNPVLLKPCTDTGSQIIVNGHVRAQMDAAAYYAWKKALIPDVQSAYDSLAEENDIIVIEGAGSPAEINLRENDFVNMGLAAMVRAPVLLAGDIDRGGVFAQLVGTAVLLDPEERARIRGFVINKFRGDPSILEPGLAELTDRTGIPVLGVLPYLDVDIDEEDSMTSRLTENQHAPLDLAVIRLPRISNFTDFGPLEAHPLFGVRYVDRAGDLGSPDCVVLPGTKSTLSDLTWLRESGLEAKILQCAARGTPVIGICGGYQMLGETLSDPCGSEGGGTLRGLGLLPQTTVFAAEKNLGRTEAVLPPTPFLDGALDGAKVSGYEIHMGETTGPSALPNVYGTYLHGFFDSGEVTERLAAALLARKGISYEADAPVSHAEYENEQMDRLAAAVREHLALRRIYEILEEGAQ